MRGLRVDGKPNCTRAASLPCEMRPDQSICCFPGVQAARWYIQGVEGSSPLMAQKVYQSSAIHCFPEQFLPAGMVSCSREKGGGGGGGGGGCTCLAPADPSAEGSKRKIAWFIQVVSVFVAIVWIPRGEEILCASQPGLFRLGGNAYLGSLLWAEKCL